MFGFPRRGLDRVEFQSAPADVVDRPAAQPAPKTISRSTVVEAFDRLMLDAHRAGHRKLVDRILDEREIVRPVPQEPVAPGRQS